MNVWKMLKIFEKDGPCLVGNFLENNSPTDYTHTMIAQELRISRTLVRNSVKKLMLVGLCEVSRKIGNHTYYRYKDE